MRYFPYMDTSNDLEFIENPSPLSEHLLDIANEEKDKVELFLKKKNTFRRIFALIKMRMMYAEKYLEIFEFVNKFKVKHGINELFLQFQVVAEKLALNNLLLAYGMVDKKCSPSIIITKEDQKLLMLRQLYEKKITTKQFKKTFGHYALNGYELASRRFSEYDDAELFTLAELLKDFKEKKEITLFEYLKSKVINKFWVYSALREELRSCTFLIISNLRYELLDLYDNKVFNRRFGELK